MVEVFKTNVTDSKKAEDLTQQIHENFKDYQANFDLDDCDLILRIENPQGEICAETIRSLLEKNGCWAEVLEDELEPLTSFLPN